MIYLDYAANTPVNEDVLQVFCDYNRRFIGNPNSYHKAGYEANQAMTQITEQLAKKLNVKTSEIIYTSGASESNNTAIKGIASTYRQKGKHIITTVLEHSSISGAFTSLQTQGYEIDLCDLQKDGRIDLDCLKDLLRKDTIMLAISYVDSEMGILQPIEEIIEILKDYPNCHLHVDATQAIGRIPVRFDGIDTMSFAPHKFFGINGCGVLVKREGFVIEPLIHGGVSTTMYRSGTPAVAMAASILEAVDGAMQRMDDQIVHVSKLNQHLREKLSAYPLVRFNSTEYSVPHILNLSVKGVKASLMQEALDQKGICVSTKSACSVKNSPSRAVYAVTKDKKNAMYSFRISMSYQTTENEIEEFLRCFDECYQELTKQQ
ncbi:MAG: cysteine desulfurase family protein [Clostridiales bacterium]|nr:cysteine desulfurase family protein [Clostridiales bacterium]